MIAATDGIGASWSSVTESQLTRSAAELSNLGGPIAVLGTVGAMLVADAAPKGRAARTAVALNAEIEAGELEATLAQNLRDALVDADGNVPQIDIRPVETLRDIPAEGWVVQTDYTLAKDGSALRVSANVAHTDDLRYLAELQRELRRREFEQQQQTRYSSRQRRLPRRRTPPRYSGTLAYHSDKFILPDTDTTYDGEQAQAMSAQIIDALDAERDMRISAARAAHAAATQAATSDGKIKRADRKLEKALAKAESLHAKGMEKASDNELTKMERLVLGAEAWREDNVLAETIEEAHDFIARALAQKLPGYGASELEGVQAVAEDPAASVVPLWSDEDGREVVQILKGPSAGIIVSLPEDGVAEYGGSVAEP